MLAEFVLKLPLGSRGFQSVIERIPKDHELLSSCLITPIVLNSWRSRAISEVRWYQRTDVRPSLSLDFVLTHTLVAPRIINTPLLPNMMKMWSGSPVPLEGSIPNGDHCWSPCTERRSSSTVWFSVPGNLRAYSRTVPSNIFSSGFS